MDSLHVNRFSHCGGESVADTASIPKPDLFGGDLSQKTEELIDRVTIMARLSDGRDREVKFVRLIRGCAAQEILAMLEEWGVGDIREAACRGMQPKLGLTISDEAWEQIRGMAPKMYGGGGIDMGMLLKILVTRPDVAGKLLEGEYRYR